MKTFKTYISEQNQVDEIQIELKNIGYPELKKVSGKRIAVLTNDNRIDVLEDIVSKLSGAKYDSTPKSDSSAGRVLYKGFTILAKPASRQGKASAGISNEYTFVSGINSVTENGPVNVVIKGKNKSFKVMGCVGAEPVGTDTAGRKKADVVLKDTEGNVYPISIKKANAETWESADSYFSEEAARLIKKAVDQGDSQLTERSGVYFLKPNIAVEATRSEKIDVMFGSDIARNGAIVTGNFSSRSFNLDDEILIINCDHVATRLSDIEGTDKDVFFLIRNDKTRRSIREYPGIRVLAAYKKRINRNVKVLKRK
mgnify:FL=1